MDKGKGKADNVFKLLITYKSTYSKANKIISSTFYKVFVSIAPANITFKSIKKSRAYINIIIREINIHILIVKARYIRIFYYKITAIIKRRRPRGILLLLL